MIRSAIAIVFLCFLGVSSVVSQQSEVFDKEKFLEMAQQGILLRMDPKELREKIKSAGLSEEEAIQMARERNIDLAKYLQAEAAAKTTLKESKEEVAQKKAPTGQAPAAPLSQFVLPELSGRAPGLQPFAYSIFQRGPSTFEPIINVPTPPNYVLGPGDEIVVNVWGETQLTYTLTVARDGYVIIPDAGKIQVANLTIDALKRRLLERMTAIYASLARGNQSATSFLDVSIGKLRTMQIFVLGEAHLPGGYSLSGLATAFTALYYAGGPNSNGTLRQIKIHRDNSAVATIDFYEFALYGKREQDLRLQEGDVLFIGQAGKRIAITGAIPRPAIYELKPGETLSDLIQMAGGLRVDAYVKRVHIERLIPFHERSKYNRDILDIDLAFSTSGELLNCAEPLESADLVTIFSISSELQNRVSISGNVLKGGSFELTPGMAVKDLVLRADGLREDTFLERATILRTRQSDLKKEIVPFHLGMAMKGDSLNNIILQRLDAVTIYNEGMFRPTHSVTLDGAVRSPGTFARTEKMTVEELIIMAGGVVEGADLGLIEVARIDTTKKEKIADIYRVSLPAEYWKAHNPDSFVLQDFDHVSVRAKPEYSTQRSVNVTGEVLYPGVYAIKEEGDRLSDLIKRFGGFKTTAYLPGVHLIRSPGTGGVPVRSPSIAESALIDSLGRPLAVPLRLAGSELAIDIRRVLRDPEHEDNLILQPGDQLVVPRDPGVVYVQGQVNTPASVPFEDGKSLKHYIRQAGGYTRNADEDNLVVILPNGKKWERSGFFLFPDPEILSGSTVIVPLKLPEKDRTLPLLKEWASITLSAATMAFIVWQVAK